MTRKSVKIFSGIAILAFAVLIFFDLEWVDAISYAVTFAALLEYFYDRWLWRINPFENTPRIFGEYDVTFHSSFNGGTKHKSTILIKQTLSSISVIEKCEDGYSESISAALFKKTANGPWHLSYTYATTPKYFKRVKNDDPHYGTVVLCLDNLNYIEGSYFTDRVNPTGGEITLKKISK